MLLVLEHFEGLEDQLWAGAKEELQHNLNYCVKQIENHPAVIESTISNMTLPELLQAINTAGKDYKQAFNELSKASG